MKRAEISTFKIVLESFRIHDDMNGIEGFNATAFTDYLDPLFADFVWLLVCARHRFYHLDDVISRSPPTIGRHGTVLVTDCL